MKTTTEPTYVWVATTLGPLNVLARGQVLAFKTDGSQVRVKFDDTGITTNWFNTSACLPVPSPLFAWLNSGAGS